MRLAPSSLRSFDCSLRALRRAALLPLLLAIVLTMVACQSDEEKIAGFLASGEEYVEAGALNEAVIEYRNVLQIDPSNSAAHYALAKAYLEQKRGKEAYWELSETVRLAPDNVDARLSLGGLALIAGNYDEALEQAERIIALDASRGAAYILKAQALERLERADEAGPAYLAAIEVSPDEGGYLLIAAGYQLRRGDRDAAEPLIRRATEVSPGFLSYSSLGRHLASDRARSEEATAAFQKAIELASQEERVAGVENLANYWRALGRSDEAVVLVERGIQEAPSESDGKLDLIYLLARFKRAQGLQEEADRLIESATTAQPNDVKPHLILSAYRGRQGDLPGALAAAEAALAVDPEDIKARLRKAELLVDMGYRGGDDAQLAEGRAIVDAILAGEPSSPDGLFVKGKVELAQGAPDAAVKALRAALDSRPEWAQAHFVLGSALTLLGEHSSARVEVARAVEIDPQLLEARRMLAKLHAALGEHEYAVEQGGVYLAARPDAISTRILVAQSLVRIGRRQAAQEQLDAIPEDQWNTEVLFARARLALGAGDTAEGRRLLLMAAQRTPHHPEILGGLLSLDRGTDRLPETRALIEAALEQRPEDAEIARLNGALALVAGDVAGAEGHLKRAIDLDPNNMMAYQQLAALYQGTGRLGETLGIYEKALERQPDSAQLHHFVAVLYEVSGRVDDAMAQYEKAIQLDGDLAQAKNNLAYLLAESGRDLDRALDLAQAAKALMPENGNAADTLGWVLHKRGISSAAVGYLKEAVASMDPGSPNLGVVRHHLAQAYEANDQPQEAIETLQVALADLENRLAAARTQGGSPKEPDWAVPARAMLSRLEAAG